MHCVPLAPEAINFPCGFSDANYGIRALIAFGGGGFIVAITRIWQDPFFSVFCDRIFLVIGPDKSETILWFRNLISHNERCFNECQLAGPSF